MLTVKRTKASNIPYNEQIRNNAAVPPAQVDGSDMNEDY